MQTLPYDDVLLTRQEFYDEVWATTPRAVAMHYGLSFRTLSEICTKHSIPRPPPDYWAKKKVGKTTPRPPLPAIEEVRLQGIRLHPYRTLPANPSSGTPAFDPEVDRLLKAEAALEPIVVPPSVRTWHPLIEQTLAERKRAADAAKARRAGDAYGIDESEPRATLNVSGATKENGARAVRIMDALLKGLEARGHGVSIKPDHYKHVTLVRVLDVAFAIRIYEPSLRKTKQPTEDDIERRRRYPHLSWRQESDLVPSGALELQVHNEGGWLLLRKWRDSKSRRLEDAVRDVPAGLLRLVDKERFEAAERDRRNAPRREAERLRKLEAERQRQVEEERKRQAQRVEALLKEVASWRRSREIREYLEALRQFATALYGDIKPGSKLADGLAWGERVAASFDPLCAAKSGTDCNRAPDQARDAAG